MIPPTSAWLDEEGMPLSQVTTFQNIAPTSAPNTTDGRDQILVDQALADRVGDRVQLRPGERQEIGGEVEEGGEGHRLDRAEQLGRDHRGDRIGGVVQAVQEIERQRQDDQSDRAAAGRVRASVGRRSAMVDDDAVDHVGDVLEGVDDPLEMLEDLALDDELRWRRRCDAPGTPS